MGLPPNPPDADRFVDGTGACPYVRIVKGCDLRYIKAKKLDSCVGRACVCACA